MDHIETLIKWVAYVADCEVTALKVGDRFDEIEGWDSLSTLRLMQLIEEEKGVHLPIYSFLQVETIQALSDLPQLKE